MGSWGPNIFEEWDLVLKIGVLKQCWISFKMKENGVLGTHSFWKMGSCLENWDKKCRFLLWCKPWWCWCTLRHKNLACICVQCQAITSINNDLLSIGPLGTNFSEIWIEIQNFSFVKMHWKCRLRNGCHLSRGRGVNNLGLILQNSSFALGQSYVCCHKISQVPVKQPWSVWGMGQKISSIC